MADNLTSIMRLLKLLPFVVAAAAAALPSPGAVDIASRASISKPDGLRFNIDGVTKCKYVSVLRNLL